MRNIKEKLMIAGIIVAIILTAAGIYSFIKINGGEWICIAQKCSLYFEGEDWVKQNCKLINNEMICEFQFQYQEQKFRIPLSGINVSDMISCGKYECVTEAFVRGAKK